MEVGTTGELFNVTAEATLVSATGRPVGNAFTEHQVRQLPLDTRNVVELLRLQPGVTSTGEVMGARRDQNNIRLDGTRDAICVALTSFDAGRDRNRPFSRGSESVLEPNQSVTGPRPKERSSAPGFPTTSKRMQRIQSVRPISLDYDAD